MTMDDLMNHIKRFFSNKNTVTFMLVIACIVIIYISYNTMVNKAISPIILPYSSQLIKEKTQITNDMVSTIEVSGTFVTSSGEGIVQVTGAVINKYVAAGYQIPENSFFYYESITDKTSVSATDFTNIPDGYTIFQLPVNFHSTYGCSIMPSNYIDLYFKASDYASDTGGKDDLIIFDKYIESIEVLAVKKEDGSDIFTNTTEDKAPEPAYLYFAVPEDYYDLLMKAISIGSNEIEIIPVPRNAEYSENPGETKIVNEAISNFILAKSVYISN